MEVKKSPQADLENKKNIFLEIGLMLALGTILFAFEWKVSGRQPADFVTVSEIPTEIEMVPITMMHQITPPPPPAPKPFDLLEIVDETDPLPDDLDIIDADDESNNKESFDLNNLNYDEEYDTRSNRFRAERGYAGISGEYTKMALKACEVSSNCP